MSDKPLENTYEELKRNSKTALNKDDKLSPPKKSSSKPATLNQFILNNQKRMTSFTSPQKKNTVLKSSKQQGISEKSARLIAMAIKSMLDN